MTQRPHPSGHLPCCLVDPSITRQHELTLATLLLLQGCLANSPHDCIGNYVVRYVLEDVKGTLRPVKVVSVPQVRRCQRMSPQQS